MKAHAGAAAGFMRGANIVVGFALLTPAEFVLVNIQQVAGQVQQ